MSWADRILGAAFLLALAASLGFWHHSRQPQPLPLRRPYLLQPRVEFSAEEAHHLWKAGSLLVDTRSPEEFGEAHAEGAWNLQPDAHLPPDLLRLLKGKGMLVIYAQAELGPAKTLSRRLRHAGLTNVGVMKGGFKAWNEGGFPVR